MNVFRKANDNDRNVDASLYMGNLDPQVTESLLYELFIQFAPVRYLNLPHDRILRSHQGYGFIEFKSTADTDYVLQALKGVRLYGKLLRLRRLEGKSLNSSTTNNGTAAKKSVDVGAKIFINNLDPLIDEVYLAETFGSFGTVIGQEIIRDNHGVSKGHGFVTFDNFDSSDKAIKNLDGRLLMNSKVTVCYAYKTGSKQRLKHGDSAERLLAANAKKNSDKKTDKKADWKNTDKRSRS